MNDWMIETRQVSRAFDKTQAVRDLNLRVRKGSLFGLLGRNGAGKTTTIKMLVGLTRPDSGEIRVNGADPLGFTIADKRKIGYHSEKQILPPYMRVKNLVRFCSQFYPDWDHALVNRLLERFRIDPAKRISALSQGGQRQTGFILALAQRPDLLILDEPAANLDAVARREFLDELLELIRQGGKTVLISSHILSDIERIADEIGIIANGTLKVSDSLDRLKETILKVRFFNFEHPAKMEIPASYRMTYGENETLATLRAEDRAVLDRLASAYHCEYETQSLSLEDLFVELSRDGMPDETGPMFDAKTPSRLR
ncbi:MAG: ABC transporter ATP-binding protein [Verrucomicrobiae bacterium]|nr:ABC transporter ATP-binding protein [Verrucomicrobiae bacterium]